MLLFRCGGAEGRKGKGKYKEEGGVSFFCLVLRGDLERKIIIYMYKKTDGYNS